MEKFLREFPPPHFRVEPSAEDDYYFIGRHSGEGRQLDVAVFRRGEGAPFLVVDAKHWRKPLDIVDVESFISFLDDVGAQIGVLVTSSRFTKASPRRAAGAHVSIHLEIVSVEEALEWDWLGLGRRIYPWDWVYHWHLGHALRLLEEGGAVDAVSEAMEEVPFEEWEAAVNFALKRHQDEARHFLGWVATMHHDDRWRFNAARHLGENGLLTESIRKRVIELEADPEARALLAEL
ncbi:restriction endonuclease [Myxococcus qinghaiensis]|uniref:restriction endonuclease n=1 Tax=Myxococcus qinghaiensis TaxID=2906758 RepID=UPI0020A828C0|nr:restriction endonuclease [Myxococcus qinghaiensis]MCP3165154.1 restriction endonuclease [Myxococcus qinghaiensis]